MFEKKSYTHQLLTKFKCLSQVVLAVLALIMPSVATAQINTAQMLNIGRNAMYFEDYVLAIQYFNQVIAAKPYLAESYFYRAVAKINLDDYQGAEEDCNKALEINPFMVDAYQVRGIARQVQRKERLAISDYESALKFLPEEKAFWLNKAVCEESLKEYAASDSSYSKLLRIAPNYDRAYLGRAQLRLAMGDSIRALEDVNKSLEIEKSNPSAYVIKADIEMNSKHDYKAALADMDEAIKLEPHFAGYFINRAYMKYNLDDYFGAMADYNYAVDLDPMNLAAHFNRGLLLAEVNDNTKAIQDFSFVIKREPENYMAVYNRALLYTKIGNYRAAISDYNKVLNRYPEFEQGLYARSECKRLLGDMAGGERDYNSYRNISKKKMSSAAARKKAEEAAEAEYKEAEEKAQNMEESESDVMNKFSTLLTVDTDSKIKPKYENKTRGRIQDRDVQIDPEPAFLLSYYDAPGKVRENTHYMREIADANETHILPFVLVLTNAQINLLSDDFQRHFESIEYYNGMLSTSQPRSIDFFARGMDFLMVKNPESAIADFDRAIAMSPKFALAYFARAMARTLQHNIMKAAEITEQPAVPQADAQSMRMLRERSEHEAMAAVIADYDEVLQLSPKNVYALFNKAGVYIQLSDYTSALSCLTTALEYKVDFGEAYYNRGLVYLRLGNKERGFSDLSKAGELGIMSAYNVLKRMAR